VLKFRAAGAREGKGMEESPAQLRKRLHDFSAMHGNKTKFQKNRS
jgi:hypothetical protein